MPNGTPPFLDTATFWLTPGSVHTVPGGRVAAWKDARTSTWIASQDELAACPQWIGGAFGDYGGVRFAGGQSLRVVASNLPESRYTLFILGRAAAAREEGGLSVTGQRMLLYSPPTVSGPALSVSVGDNGLASYHFPIWAPAFEKSRIVGALCPLTIRQEQFDYAIYLNGPRVIDSGVMFGHSELALTLGGVGDNRADGFIGDLAELILYPWPLSDAERLQVETYFQAKYNCEPENSSSSSSSESSSEPPPSSSSSDLPSSSSSDLPSSSSSGLLSSSSSAEPSSSSSSEFSEESVPDPVPVTAGLNLWLRSDRHVGFQGTQVQSWADARGLPATTASQDDPAKQPGWQPQNLPPHGALGFANDQYLQLSPDHALPAGDFTLFVVARPDAERSPGAPMESGQRLLWTDSAMGSFLSISAGTNGLAVYATSTGPAPLLESNAGLEALCPLMVHYQEGQGFLGLNGAILASASGAGSVGVGRQIGGLGHSSLSFSGGIAEILLYDRPLFESERLLVATYLQNRYDCLPGSSSSSSSAEPSSSSSAEPSSSSSSEEPSSSSSSSDGGESSSSEEFSSSSSFTPEEVPNPVPVTAGLHLWLRSDRHLSAVDSLVQSWADARGLPLTAIQTASAAQPHLAAQGFSLQPAVVFDGDDSLQLPLDHSLPADDFTLIVLARPTAYRESGQPISIGQRLLWSGTGQESCASVSLGSNGIAIYESPLGEGPFVDSLYYAQALCPLVVRYQNGGRGIWGNGSFINNGSGSYPTGITLGHQIGGMEDPSLGFVGDIAEILLYDRALNENERLLVETYLQNRYDCQPIDSSSSSEEPSSSTSDEPSSSTSDEPSSSSSGEPSSSSEESSSSSKESSSSSEESSSSSEDSSSSRSEEYDSSTSSEPGPIFNLYPTEEDIFVSADAHTATLVASVFFPVENDDSDEEVPIQSATIEWEIIEGDGGSLSSTQTSTTNGYATVNLTTSTEAGTLYQVRAKLVSWSHGEHSSGDTTGEGPTLTSSAITVVHGAVASFQIDKDKESLPADGKSRLVVKVSEPLDQYENPISDGTVVGWRVEGMGELLWEETDTEIADGEAMAVTQSGIFEGEQAIKIQVGEYQQTVTVQINGLIIDLTTSTSQLDIARADSAELRATITDTAGNPVADGTEVTWFTSNGRILGNVTTVAGGEPVSVTLSSVGGHIGRTLVAVMVGNAATSTRLDFNSSALLRATVSRPNIAGDAATDGERSFEQIEGGDRIETYQASSVLTIEGESNQTVRVELQGAVASHFNLSGLSPDGTLTLDGDGQGLALVSSNGTLAAFDPEFGNTMPGLKVWIRDAEDAAKTAEVNIQPAPNAWITGLKNAARGFVWGDGDGVDALVGDFAAGMLIWGDIRDMVKELGKLVPGGDEPDWVNFGFALAGLITEFAPGIGEIPDSVIEAIRVILKRIPKGPLADALTRIVKELARLLTHGSQAVIEYVNRYKDFILDFFGRGVSAWRTLHRVIRREDSFELFATLYRKIGDKALTHILNIADDTNLGPEIAEKVIHVLAKGIDDAVLDSIKNSDAAMKGLAKALKAPNINDQALNSILKNKLAFTEAGQYTAEKLLTNMGDVAHVDGFAKLIKAMNSSPDFPNAARGRRYELDVGADLQRKQGNVTRFSEQVRSAETGRFLTDYDIIDANGIVYQAKSGRLDTLEKFKDFNVLAAARAGNGGAPRFDKVKWVVPDPGVFTEEMRKYMQKQGMPEPGIFEFLE